MSRRRREDAAFRKRFLEKQAHETAVARFLGSKQREATLESAFDLAAQPGNMCSENCGCSHNRRENGPDTA